MKIQFWGATNEVTGSKHILEINGTKILLDCGMYQGWPPDEIYTKNQELIMCPSEIDCIIVSHAHIDHSGLLPYFVKNGFSGKIYTTSATKNFLPYLLEDSAYIQSEEINFLKKKHLENEIVENLYEVQDIPQVIKQCFTLDYDHSININDTIKLTFKDAGHILGSAIVILDYIENDKKQRLVFTGDLGRKGLPILRDPEVVNYTDFLITESTYGDRLHDDIKNMEIHLKREINATYEKGGKIIIPAFSLERTQELIYLLHLLHKKQEIPDLEIFVDSPLSYNLTTVFKMHPECYDMETYEDFIQQRRNPFGFSKLKYITEVEDSKALNFKMGSFIVISSAGMCNAGRIKHHLVNNIEDDRNTVLIIGFQAKNTLGRQLVEGEKKVKIFGKEYEVNADIKVLNAFSAHADQKDIIEWISNISRLKKVFLVHGEDDATKKLKKLITTKFQNLEVLIPSITDKFEV